MIHIYYCNDGFKRNWIKIKQIENFSTKENIIQKNPKIIVSKYFLTLIICYYEY